MARETLDHVGQQGALAGLALAEEMGAAGDVEQQAGIAAEAAGAAGFRSFFGNGAAQRIDRHPRRVAIAPVGDGLDPSTVGRWLVGRRDQVRHQRACIGQSHVAAQAGGAGMRIDRGQPWATVEPGDGGSRPSRPVAIRRRGRRSRESIRGELGKPKRDNAFHRSTPRARKAFP